MNSSDNIAPSLLSKINNIMDVAGDNHLYLDIEFKLASGDYIAIPYIFIDYVGISQLFTSAYRDVIMVALSLELATYVRLSQNGQGLKASLKFYKLDGPTRELIESTTYTAIIVDRADPAIKLSSGVLNNIDNVNTELVPMYIELIDNVVMTGRKENFNFILNNATMETCLLTIAYILGYKDKVYITKPDNNTVYKNLTIPPMHNMESIFNYLQSTFGVYASGIRAYVSENKLYVHARDNTSAKHSVDIYSTGSDMYTGSDGYHTRGLNNLSLVTVGEPLITETNQSEMENIGTSFVLSDPTVLAQGVGKVVNGMFMVDTKHLTLMTSGNEDSGTTTDTHNQKFVTTGNLYPYVALLGAYDTMEVEVTWAYARPFLIYPSSKLKFHYSKNGNISTASGMCNGCVYSILPSDNMSGAFVCTATINMSVK